MQAMARMMYRARNAINEVKTHLYCLDTVQNEAVRDNGDTFKTEKSNKQTNKKNNNNSKAKNDHFQFNQLERTNLKISGRQRDSNP